MSITTPVVGIHSDGYENDIVPVDGANSKPLVPNYGPYYYHAKRGEHSNLKTYHDGLNEIVHDGNRISRNNPCQIAIIKRYTSVSKCITGRASSSLKKEMIEMFGRVIDVQMSDLTGAEENFLNHMHELCFEEQVGIFETQLHHMKNKIGVFRDPIFPQSLPWIIPRFTFDCEKGDTYKKAHVFIINQEFHRANALVHKETDDEFSYWQFKHYEIFHVNDPSVTWGPYDVGMHNLMFDNVTRQICFIDNEGFKSFTFDRHDTNRYKVMSMINPNIGEYLPGKDCNTPHEVIKNDWIMNGDVKVFFKRLYFYTKVIFNLQSSVREESYIKGVDMKNASSDEITEKIINECRVGLESGKLLYQNWFHHEGDRVMHMTEEYVPAHPDAKRLSNNFIVGDEFF